MAETKGTERSGQTGQALERQQRGRGLRAAGRFDPFELMDRMTQEMDRWFDRIAPDFGSTRRMRMPRSLFGSAAGEGVWFPRVDAIQRGDQFIVRADLPGLKKDDIEVDLTDDAVTIRGERRVEQESEGEGYWRSEREYGQFQRTIPLPEGVIGESAKATFRDGVLEITMEAAPSEANRGRRLEIAGDSGGQQKR